MKSQRPVEQCPAALLRAIFSAPRTAVQPPQGRRWCGGQGVFVLATRPFSGPCLCISPLRGDLCIRWVELSLHSGCLCIQGRDGRDCRGSSGNAGLSYADPLGPGREAYTPNSATSKRVHTGEPARSR